MRLMTVTLLYTQRKDTALQTSAASNGCHLPGRGRMPDGIESWMGELCRSTADSCTHSGLVYRKGRRDWLVTSALLIEQPTAPFRCTQNSICHRAADHPTEAASEVKTRSNNSGYFLATFRKTVEFSMGCTSHSDSVIRVPPAQASDWQVRVPPWVCHMAPLNPGATRLVNLEKRGENG